MATYYSETNEYNIDGHAQTNKYNIDGHARNQKQIGIIRKEISIISF